MVLDSAKVLILADKLNEFFKTSYNDGSMKKCAETYGVQDAIIEQK